MDQTGCPGEIQIPSRRGIVRMTMSIAIVLLCLGCVFFVVSFFAREMDYGFCGMGAAMILLGGLLLLGRKSLFRVYLLNDEGIYFLNKPKPVVLWADVVDLELKHPLGVGELEVKLIKQNKKKVSIACGMMEDGGRRLVDELQKRMPAFFERHARKFLTGELHWQLGAMKDVVRFENGMLMLNVPRPRIVPLRDVKRIEWIPGVVSGARKGGLVLVEFGGERVDLKLGIKGIQYFLYAAKYMFGLGNRVNPPFPAEARQKIDAARKKQNSLYVMRTLYFMMIFWPFIFFMRDVPDYINDEATDDSGLTRNALITDIKGTSVELKYNDRDKNPRTAKVHVQKSFADSHRVGDKFKIKVHRNNPNWVLFDGKIRHNGVYLVRSLQFSAVIACIGIALLIWTYLRKRRLDREAERLEKEAVAAMQSAPLAQDSD